MGFPTVYLIGFILTWVLAGAYSAACNFPAIYNFGDSNSDTGGISAAFDPIIPPYGQDFFLKGRASNGRLVLDFLAEKLKLPYLSAYLDSIGANFRHGANFATGGSTVLKPNETIYESGISPFFLNMQIDQFVQFKSRTAVLYARVKGTPEAEKLARPEDFSKSLYTFDIGQNDLAFGFRKLNSIQQKQAIPYIVEELATAIKRLYKEGGRAFWVHNTGPIGCLPQNRFYLLDPPADYVDEYGCVKFQNDIAIQFNTVLNDRIVKLRTELPETAITCVDVHAAKYGLISNTGKEGFEGPLKVCCGFHHNYTHVWCGTSLKINDTEISGQVCKNPERFLSWDGIHYSQAANKLIANQTQNGFFTDPPTPVTAACHHLWEG